MNLLDSNKTTIETFYKKKSDYDSKVTAMSKSLEIESTARGQAQDEHFNIEQQVHEFTCKNLELKQLNFKLNYQATHYQTLHQMSERRVKILTEKKGILAKELAQINLVQTKELKRLRQELSDTIG